MNVLQLPLLLLSPFPISSSQGWEEVENLPVSFSQDSPVATSKAGPAGELLSQVSCPHGDSQERRSSQCKISFPNPDPSPLQLHPAHPNPEGAQLAVLIQHPSVGFGKENLNVSKGNLEDFLCPMHLGFWGIS